MADRPYNVLFLCTGNSARSIIGEAILNKVGAGHFLAYSAGSQPKGRINPNAIQLLQSLGYDTSGYRMTAHWGIPDPAEATGSQAEIALAFKDAYRLLNQRIGIFTALPLRSLDRLSLQSKLRDIGDMEGSTAKVTEAT